MLGIKSKIKQNIIKVFYKLKFKDKLQIGKNFTFNRSLYIQIENYGKISIGDNCFFNNYCSITSLGNISIGNDCVFGENVKIYDHNHSFRKGELIRKQKYSVGSVKIGNNTWIGTGCVILKNANIGDNCVVAAGEIIDFDVPNNMIVKNSRFKEIVKKV